MCFFCKLLLNNFYIKIIIVLLLMLNRENGLEPELDSYTALLGIYGEAGDMEAIMSVCEDLSKINCTSLASFDVFLFFFDSMIIQG